MKSKKPSGGCGKSLREEKMLVSWTRLWQWGCWDLVKFWIYFDGMIYRSWWLMVCGVWENEVRFLTWLQLEGWCRHSLKWRDYEKAHLGDSRGIHVGEVHERQVKMLFMPLDADLSLVPLQTICLLTAKRQQNVHPGLEFHVELTAEIKAIFKAGNEMKRKGNEPSQKVLNPFRI